MTNLCRRLNARKLAEYLWYRFRIQPGKFLCIALNQPNTPENFEALVAWCRVILDGYDFDGPPDLVHRIAGDLAEWLFEAGLSHDILEMYPVPASIEEDLYQIPANQPDYDHLPTVTKGGNVVDLETFRRRK